VPGILKILDIATIYVSRSHETLTNFADELSSPVAGGEKGRGGHKRVVVF